MAEIELVEWACVVDQLKTILTTTKVTTSTDQTDSPYNATAALVKSQGKACLIVAVNVSKDQIVSILQQLDLFAGTPAYTTVEVGFNVEQTANQEKVYMFQVGGGLTIEVVWEGLKGMQEKLKDHKVPSYMENPIKKWMVSKTATSIIVQDAGDNKDKDKEYMEGCVSINELCLNQDGTLALSFDPIKLGDIAGLAIFGYTG